jgi:hypothetical protein
MHCVATLYQFFFSVSFAFRASLLSSNVSFITTLDAAAVPSASYLAACFVCALSRRCHFFIIGGLSSLNTPAVFLSWLRRREPLRWRGTQ